MTKPCTPRRKTAADAHGHKKRQHFAAYAARYKNEQIDDDRRARLALRVAKFCLRIDDRAAYASADQDDVVVTRKIGRVAQRSDDVVKTVALFERAHLVSAVTHVLHKQCDRARVPVVVANGERDPLALVVHADDDELSRQAMSGNVGRGDHILFYARRDVVDLDQFVHFYTSPHMRQNVVFFCARVRQRRFCVSAYNLP